MHPVVKPTVFFGGALGVLVLAVCLSIFKISTAIAYRVFDVHTTPVAAATDAPSRARGEHLARVVLGCTDCHGDNLAGSMLVEDSTIGTIAAPNLTHGEGGRSAEWTDLDYTRAVRNGVETVGRGLWLMPTRAYASISDPDMAALLSELNAAPPVAKRWPDIDLTFIGRFRVAFRQVRLLQATEAQLPIAAAAEPGPSAAYGQYLAAIAGCVNCHNEAPSLPSGTPALPLNRETLSHYKANEFVKLMRQGVRPDGTSVGDNRAMQRLRGLSDTEVAALWAYLPTLDL